MNSEFKLKDNLSLALLISIILLGLTLRLFYRCGLCISDSYSYVNGAIRLNDYGIREYLSTVSNIYENRISIVLPLAFVFKLFGISEFSTMLLPLFYAVGTIITVYFLGKQLFNEGIGLLAALLVTTIPLDVFASTAVMPDSIIPFYSSLIWLCFLLGQKKDNQFFYFLAGFFLFCAFEARATSGVLIFPLVLAAWWSTKRSIWSLLLPTFTFFALIFVYWGILFLLTGDFFAQFALLTRDATAEGYVGTGEFLGHFKKSFRLSVDFGLLYVMAFPALIIGLYKSLRDERYRLPVIAFLVLYLFFEFGTTTLTSYQPIWKLSRFLTILSVPVSLLVAAVVVFIFSKSHRWFRLMIFALVTLQSLFVIALTLYNRGLTQEILDYDYPYKVAITQLSDYENVEVIHVVHRRWAIYGRFYARLNDQIYQYQNLENQLTDDIKNGEIVIYDSLYFTPYGEIHLDSSSFPALQMLPERTPDNWQQLFVINRDRFPDFPVYVYLVER
jgi:hypothetical protein